MKYFPTAILCCCFLALSCAVGGCSSGATATSPPLLSVDCAGTWSGDWLYEGIWQGTMEISVKNDGTFSGTCPNFPLGGLASGTLGANGDVLFNFSYKYLTSDPFKAGGRLDLAVPGCASGVLNATSNGTRIATVEISLKKS